MSDDRIYALSTAALDQIHGRLLAAEIVAIRLWGFLALTQPDPRAYLDAQMAQCLQNVYGAKIDGENADRIKQFAGQAVSELFQKLVVAQPRPTRPS